MCFADEGRPGNGAVFLQSGSKKMTARAENPGCQCGTDKNDSGIRQKQTEQEAYTKPCRRR